jgi:Zn-dependent peptidase ImmA (M78 family)
MVSQWLNGERLPTFRQAKLAAKKLRVPFGFLFLDEPPDETLPIPDFRTVDGQPIDNISLDLRDLLYSVLRKQEWLSQYLAESGSRAIGLVGSRRREHAVSVIADDIRTNLDLRLADRPSRSDTFLRQLVQRAEDVGIAVLRSGIVGNDTHRKLNVREFRGFSLSDSFAPLIFINSADAPPAQVFTLVHELAHIWRGDTGISGSLDQSSAFVERLCNQVAAEVLVPQEEFILAWQSGLDVHEAIKRAAGRFRVSRYVSAIRAFESGFIDQGELASLLEEYRAEGARTSNAEGGDYYRTLIARNSRTITEGVVDAISRQRVLIREAAGLLDAKPSQLERIARELQGAA